MVGHQLDRSCRRLRLLIRSSPHHHARQANAQNDLYRHEKARPELDDFRAYYLNHHAPLFLKNAPQACKYTINFPTHRPGKEPPALAYDFIAEIWWEDGDAMRAFYKSQNYQDIIEPDEQKLFATGSSIYFDEHVQKA